MKYPADAHEERIKHHQDLINEVIKRFEESKKMLEGDSKYRKVEETLIRLNDVSLNLLYKELDRFKKEYEDDVNGRL